MIFCLRQLFGRLTITAKATRWEHSLIQQIMDDLSKAKPMRAVGRVCEYSEENGRTYNLVEGFDGSVFDPDCQLPHGTILYAPNDR